MIEQYGNQFWTAKDWDEFFDKLDKLPGTVYQKLKDINFFAQIDQYYSLSKLEIPLVALNRLLFAECGKRLISPLVGLSEDDITTQSANELAAIIVTIYKQKWDRLWEIYSLEYDPIHNYKEVYSETTTGSQVDDIDVAKNKSNSLSKSGSDTKTTTYDTTNKAIEDVTNSITKDVSDSSSQDVTNSSKEDGTNSSTGSGTDSVYGFNSSSAVPSDTTATTASDISTTTTSDTSKTIRNDASNTTTNETHEASNSLKKTGTITEENTLGSGTTGSETGSEEFDSTTTTEGTKDYTKSGNIGNIPTQQLINQEINLWKWSWLREVINDIKHEITIPVYG